MQFYYNIIHKHHCRNVSVPVVLFLSNYFMKNKNSFFTLILGHLLFKKKLLLWRAFLKVLHFYDYFYQSVKITRMLYCTCV